MSIIENQMKLGRELFEINTHIARRMTEIAGDGFKQYFETNQEFAKRLAEVRDLSSFVELQRDYGQTLYNGMTERMQTRGEVIKEAVERGGDAMRDAFNVAQETAEQAVQEATDAAAAATESSAA